MRDRETERPRDRERHRETQSQGEPRKSERARDRVGERDQERPRGREKGTRKMVRHPINILEHIQVTGGVRQITVREFLTYTRSLILDDACHVIACPLVYVAMSWLAASLAAAGKNLTEVHGDPAGTNTCMYDVNNIERTSA